MPATTEQVAYTTVPALAQPKTDKRVVSQVDEGGDLMKKLRALAARNAIRIRVE